MKNDIVLFIVGCMMIGMASCLGGDYTDNTAEIKDAQISSFVLSHDSVTGLGDVKFTIDQVNGYIFNRDSLPFGTQIGKVVCTLTYSTGVSGVKIVQEALGDTVIWWNGTDSLDFSRPVKFTTQAYDGVTTKLYTARVNIHQVIPDLMVWERYNSRMTGATADNQKVVAYPYEGADAYLMYAKTGGVNRLYYSLAAETKNEWKELPLSGLPETADVSLITSYENSLYVPDNGLLYQSEDGRKWVKVENTPAVKTILGVLKEGRNTPSRLAAIVESEKSYFFAGMNREKQWEKGDPVPDNFPVSGFGNVGYYRMDKEYLTVVAGEDRDGKSLNTTWSTENALSWAFLSGERENFFEKKAGVMLALYDDKFYLAGGINAEGKASKDIHVSADNGVTWSVADSLKAFPEEYTARGYASVHVEAGKSLFIFGGKINKGAKTLDEIWCGRINRLR
jgi:hypothetical protein